MYCIYKVKYMHLGWHDKEARFTRTDNTASAAVPLLSNSLCTNMTLAASEAQPWFLEKVVYKFRPIHHKMHPQNYPEECWTLSKLVKIVLPSQSECYFGHFRAAHSGIKRLRKTKTLHLWNVFPHKHWQDRAKHLQVLRFLSVWLVIHTRLLVEAWAAAADGECCVRPLSLSAHTSRRGVQKSRLESQKQD